MDPAHDGGSFLPDPSKIVVFDVVRIQDPDHAGGESVGRHVRELGLHEVVVVRVELPVEGRLEFPDPAKTVGEALRGEQGHDLGGPPEYAGEVSIHANDPESSLEMSPQILGVFFPPGEYECDLVVPEHLFQEVVDPERAAEGWRIGAI